MLVTRPERGEGESARHEPRRRCIAVVAGSSEHPAVAAAPAPSLARGGEGTGLVTVGVDGRPDLRTRHPHRQEGALDAGDSELPPEVDAPTVRGAFRRERARMPRTDRDGGPAAHDAERARVAVPAGLGHDERGTGRHRDHLAIGRHRGDGRVATVSRNSSEPTGAESGSTGPSLQAESPARTTPRAARRSIGCSIIEEMRSRW